MPVHFKAKRTSDGADVEIADDDWPAFDAALNDPEIGEVTCTKDFTVTRRDERGELTTAKTPAEALDDAERTTEEEAARREAAEAGEVAEPPDAEGVEEITELVTEAEAAERGI